MDRKQLNALKREVLAKLGNNCNADDFGIKGGRVYARRAYFYRMGATAEKFAAKVQAALGDGYTVYGEDHWAEWPKTSYFYAFITKATPVAAAV